jgi:hypothetical protein
LKGDIVFLKRRKAISYRHVIVAAGKSPSVESKPDGTKVPKAVESPVENL